MKRSLFLVVLLGFLGVCPGKAASYLSEGVNTDDLANSARFYDVGKGFYWPGNGKNSISGTFEQYQASGNNFSFLGELEQRVSTNTEYKSEYDFAYGDWSKNLKDDANTCWYQTAANVIQYWQTYYGVFAKDSSQLPYGLTYGRDQLNALGGTQSLEVGMVFYDNIANEGGFLRGATDYYFSGGNLANVANSWRYDAVDIDDNGNFIYSVTSVSTIDYTRKNVPEGGKRDAAGYYADYFPDALSVGSDPFNLTATTIEVSENNQDAGNALLEAMGCFVNEDGEIVQNVVGQLGSVSLRANGVGHAITCYGFTLNDDGSIKSLKVTNSDDWEYKLFDVYVGKDMTLYTDESCGEKWIYSERNWMINAFEYINTPDELVQMYSTYSSPESNLEWNGKANVWSAKYTSTTDELPTAATGWEVYVDSATNDEHDRYYSTYYSEERVVEFGDHGGEVTEIKVDGEVCAGGMELTASKGVDYKFIGDSAESDKINLTGEHSVGDLLKTGGGADSLCSLTLMANNVSLKAGELRICDGSVLIAENGVIYDGAVLTIGEDGETKVNTLVVQEGGILNATVGSTYTGSLTLQQGAVFEFDLTGLATHVLDFSGTLSLSGEVLLQWIGAESMISLFSSEAADSITLIQFDSVQNFDPNLFRVSGGSVVYDAVNKSLVLTVPEPATATLSLLALAGLAVRRRRK